ncbi:hypothetical protein ACFFVK_09180, partial [Flavobacterium gyeonganense]
KKLLVLIYHIWKKDQAYDPDYAEKKKTTQEDIINIVDANSVKKNSPNQVEATADKQFIFENELLSIV